MKPLRAFFKIQADRWLAALLLIYSLGVSTWMVASGLHVTMEDGYYYYKIAQNIAQGAGSSFDGIHLTNGYHPLWLFCLASVFKFVGGIESRLILGTFLQAIFLAAATILVYCTSRLLCSRLPAFLAAMLWVMLTVRVALGGLEFSLHALMICAVAYVCLRWFGTKIPERTFPYTGFGILMGLTILARLDTILLAFILGAYLVWRQINLRSGLEGFLRLGGYVLPVLIVVIAYLTANRLVFGHGLPVSSAIKREWSSYLLEHDPSYLSNGWLAAKFFQVIQPLKSFIGLSSMRPVALGIFGASSVWLVSLFVRKPALFHAWARQTIFPLTPFVLFGIISYLNYTFTFHGSLSFSPWYFVIQPWLAAMTAGALAELLVRGWERLDFPWKTQELMELSKATLVVAYAAIIIFTIVSIFRWRSREIRNPNLLLLHDAAQWAKNHLPEDARIGTWNAGTIGYISERRVINLDGVVNNWEYYEGERQDLCRYWDEQNITYLLDVFQGDQVLTAVPFYPYYKDCADRLELIWQADQYSPDWSLKAYRIRSPGSE